MNSPHLRPAVACLVDALLHVAAQFSARFFEAAPGISLWYPPAGLALSLLVLLGPRMAWVVFLTNAGTALATDLSMRLQGNGSAAWPWWPSLAYPAIITANYTAVAFLARRWLGRKLLPGTTRETALFALVMFGGPLGVAFAGTALGETLHSSRSKEFLDLVTRWWVGDLSGLLTVVPVAMVFAGPWIHSTPTLERPALPRGSLLAHAAVQALALVGVIWAVFTIEPLPSYDAFYLCFLPLIWICLRHGLPGATLAALAITMGSLIGMHLTGSSTGRIVNFLLFEVTVAVVGLGLGSTVSRRNAAEAKLTASEAQLDRVIAGAQLGLWDWNIPTREIAHNRRCAEMFGLSPDELGPEQDKWRSRLHPDDLPAVGQAMKDHLEGRSPLVEIEYRVAARSGEWRWVHTRGSVVARDRQGRPTLVSGTHLDVTDRKRAEAEVHRLLEIVEATTDFTLTTDRDGRILYANTALLRVLEVPTPLRLRGRPLSDLFAEAGVALLRAEIIPTALRSGTWHGELGMRVAQGRDVPVSLVAVAHRDGNDGGATLSFVMRDISRLKQAEAEKLEHERHMQQIQRSESLGVLAGGIAHDFNNLLTTVVGNASLARLELAESSPLHEALGHIERAAQRAAGLCQQMLAYAGRSTLVFGEVDVNALIEETRQLLQVSISKKVTFELALTRPLARVRAAPPQLQQVVMNLALNGAEAIGDKEGTLTLRTSCRSFGPAELRDLFEASSLPPGDYVLIEVEDSGRGMTPEVRARIFEPFFTTKFTGHGLGLAAVLGIVKSHRGAVHVLSTPGRGSTFRVLLPALAAGAAHQPPTIRTGGKFIGSGTVLVVDDEAGVRDITAQMVKSHGFKPLVAADGVEGVEIFERNADTIRLVLLDLTMPRMDGEEAFGAIHRINPRVPVVLMSGYSEKLTYERFNDPRPAGFLTKPFSLQALREQLEHAAASAPAAGPAR